MGFMMKLAPGQNTTIESTGFELEVLNLEGESTALILESHDSRRKIKNDFIRRSGSLNADINLLEFGSGIEKLIVFVVKSHEGNEDLSKVELKIKTNNQILSVSPDLVGRNPSMRILCEFYLRNNAWKVRCLGDGFDSIDSAARYLGVPTSEIIARNSLPRKPAEALFAEAKGDSGAEFGFQQNLTRGRNMWDKFKKVVREKSEDLATELKKFKNKEFLNAAMAGSVLVAVADGSVSSDEKQKMLRFIKTNEALKVFDSKKVIETFNKYLDIVDFDLDAGRAECLSALAKLKGKDDQARLVVRMVIAIGESDGDFDADERKVVEEISKEMNVSF